MRKYLWHRLARHPKEALRLVIGGKDKRKGSEHHKGPIDKEAASRSGFNRIEPTAML